MFPVLSCSFPSLGTLQCLRLSPKDPSTSKHSHWRGF